MAKASDSGAVLHQPVNGNSYTICCPACDARFSVGRFYRAKWSLDDVADLRRLYARGLTFGQIAMKLGRSRNSVASKVRTLGLGARAV